MYKRQVTALANAGKNDVQVIGGRYGLGSKDTPPASVFAVYSELKKDEMKRQFTIGIVDDVTNLSLPEDANCPNTAAEGTIECKFWGLGLSLIHISTQITLATPSTSLSLFPRRAAVTPA